MLNMKVNKLFVYFLFGALFFSTSTTYTLAPLFVLLMLLLSIVIFSFNFKNTTFSKTFSWYFLLMGYCVLSALISGIPIYELFSYDSIRYDSNIFFTFIPLIFLPFISVGSYNLKKKLSFFVLLSPFILILQYALFGDFFFISHNALGGFLMIVCAINITLLKNRFSYVALFLNLSLLYLSASRGSMIGLLFGFFLFKLLELNYRKTAIAYLVILFFSFGILLIWAHDIWVASGSPVVLDIMEFANQDFSGPIGDVTGVGERGATIAHRLFFIWPVAVQSFFDSPIFGIGFGRFDDLPHNMSGVLGIFSMNMGAPIMHTDLHAHNSVLHFLAELGLVGAFIVFRLFREILNAAKAIGGDYYRIISLMTYVAFFSSMTEHRLTTPAQMFPYMIVVTLIIGCKKKNNKKLDG